MKAERTVLAGVVTEFDKLLNDVEKAVTAYVVNRCMKAPRRDDEMRVLIAKEKLRAEHQRVREALADLRRNCGGAA